MNRYNESGSNGIYYVNYSSDKLFSYDSINYNYTLRVVLNSNKEIEHVVTDKNLESYIEEILVTDVQYEIENVVNIHADNTDIHITPEEKTIISDVKKINYSEVEDIIWSNQETTNQGDANVKSIHFSRNHFINGELGKITSIKIPTSDNDKINTNEAWLAVQLFKNGTAIGNVIYSDNTQTKGIAHDNNNEYNFIFNDNELILTDYDVIKMSMVEDKNVTFNPISFIPNVTNDNGNNVAHEFRIKVTTGHSDNICCAYDSGSSWKNWLMRTSVDVSVYHEYIHTAELHVTPHDKEKWNAAAERIAELEAMVATLTAQLTQLTSQN